METFIFDKNEYQSYEDMYRDIAHKMRSDIITDYYDTKTFDFSPDILWEYLLCEFQYSHHDIKIILKNFDLDEIRKQKTFENYKLNLIIETFEDFVEKYPNNKLEFIND